MQKAHLEIEIFLKIPLLPYLYPYLKILAFKSQYSYEIPSSNTKPPLQHSEIQHTPSTDTRPPHSSHHPPVKPGMSMKSTDLIFGLFKNPQI